jgi:hypothetical protein
VVVGARQPGDIRPEQPLELLGGEHADRAGFVLHADAAFVIDIGAAGALRRLVRVLLLLRRRSGGRG